MVTELAAVGLLFLGGLYGVGSRLIDFYFKRKEQAHRTHTRHIADIMKENHFGLER